MQEIKVLLLNEKSEKLLDTSFNTGDLNFVHTLYDLITAQACTVIICLLNKNCNYAASRTFSWTERKVAPERYTKQKIKELIETVAIGS
ncbi:hypothetical protein [Paenibacillus elgii]|uniref:hypothetical protein n=1 Tax=Paenibacillus elgii TaxID=189691 RepID=UPI0013D20AFC|nr:hypothetical protein [Paenibacillus elgii]